MTSSALAVTFCSQALVMIGADPVTSLEDGTREATVAASLYQPQADAALCSYPWRFAMAQRRLARLSAPPLARADAAYQIPADCLMMRAVTILDHPVRYEIYNDMAFVDAGELDEVYADYLYRADEAHWPPLFRLGLTYDLAASFAVALAEDEQKQDRFVKLAQITWAKARASDGQSRTARSGLRSRLLNFRRS